MVDQFVSQLNLESLFADLSVAKVAAVMAVMLGLKGFERLASFTVRRVRWSPKHCAPATRWLHKQIGWKGWFASLGAAAVIPAIIDTATFILHDGLFGFYLKPVKSPVKAERQVAEAPPAPKRTAVSAVAPKKVPASQPAVQAKKPQVVPAKQQELLDDITYFDDTSNIHSFQQYVETENGVRKLHGLCQQFHANGQLALQGEYRMGERHGRWTWYKVDGSVSHTNSY